MNQIDPPLNLREMLQNEILLPIIQTIELQQEPITHLVLSGGGVWGLPIYGALLEMKNNGIFDIENIKTIYSTSVGTIIATLIAMKFDWEIYTDYLIKRPWNKVWNIEIEDLINAYDSCGIYDKDFIRVFVEPFLKARDMELNVTLLDFYKQTNIEIHMFVTELNEFKPVDISYKTHPDWQLLDAIYASCAIPIIYKPYLTKDNCYIDGCFFTNYPIQPCIENIGIENIHRILGICLKYNLKNIENITESNITNIFDYFLTFMQRIVHNRLIANISTKSVEAPHTLYVSGDATTLSLLEKLLNHSTERREMIELGKTEALAFIKTHFSNPFIRCFP